MDSTYIATARRLHKIIITQVEAFEGLVKDGRLLAIEEIARIETLAKTLALLAERIKPPGGTRYPRGARIEKVDLRDYASDKEE